MEDEEEEGLNGKLTGGQRQCAAGTFHATRVSSLPSPNLQRCVNGQ